MNSLIRNRKKVRQVIDFTGVQNGNMHPSDIDAVLEFDTKKSIVLKVEHDFDNDEENIPLDKCVVTGIYYDKKWIYYTEHYNFKHYINKLGEKWDCEKCRF